MKLLGIYVEEERRTATVGEIDYDEVRVHMYEELPKEGRYYLMNEYSREKGKLLRIGVSVQGAEHVIAQDSWGGRITLNPSTCQKDLWYEKRQSWIANGYEQTKEALFGANACGEWTIIAYGKQGKMLSTEKVKVIPSLLSVEQYYVMQMEVKKQFEELAFKPTEKDDRDIIRELQVPLFPIVKFKKLFDEWIKWLQQIELNPAEILMTSNGKISKQHIKSWAAKTILESAMFPYREKLSVKTTIKVVDLPEHQMIKAMLEQIRERISQESITEQAVLSELKGIVNGFVEIDVNKRSDNLVSKTIQKRKQQINNDLKVLQKRQLIWQQCNKMLQTCLSNVLFDVKEQEPTWTHLFSSHHVYRSVFEMYEKITELTTELTPKERDFEKTILNSPNLFEIWILFQLIHKFQKLQFSAKGVSDSLVSYYDEHKSLSGWKQIFTSKQDTMVLYYEPEMMLDDGGCVKPDYMIITKNKDNSNWQGHTLDAKYKPYTTLSLKVLPKDLEHSGRRYLRIVHNKVEMKTASLVHIDKNTSNWNIDANKDYSLSQFSAMPGHVENIQTYMKRIFHFFLGKHDMCPSCGQSTEVIDEIYKQTYICTPCDEVWVNNVCKYRKDHPLEAKLLKYPSGNYNVQVGNQWNVYCPICAKDVNGNKNEYDPFGNVIG